MAFRLKLSFLAVLTLSALLFSRQVDDQGREVEDSATYRNAFTIGLLQGGGSLIGVDYERLIMDRVGVTFLYRAKVGFTAQIGAGYVMARGKVLEDYYEDKGIDNPPAVILLYSLGWYFKG